MRSEATAREITDSPLQTLQDLEKIRMKQGFDPQDFGLARGFGPLQGLVSATEVGGEDEDEDEDDDADEDPYCAKHLSMIKKMAKESLLQQQNRTVSQDDSPPPTSLSVPSDIISGVILAGDILHKKTSNKRFNRKIYLLTDAESKLKMDPMEEEFCRVLAGLKRLEVAFTVIGLDFETEGEFDESGNIKKPKKERTKTEILMEIGKANNLDDGSSDEGNESHSSSDGDDDDESDNDSDDDSDHDSPEVVRQKVKEENEKVLMSIAKTTRGNVIAARNLIEMTKVAGAKRIPKSTKKKFTLYIAPNLPVEADYSLLISKANLQTLKTHALNRDEAGNIITDADNIPIHSDIIKESSYRDPKNPDIEMDPKYRAKAYRYGSDYITTNAYDEISLKTQSPVEMHILGYATKDNVEVRFDEERSNELTTQSQATKTAHARTSVQDTPPPQPPQQFSPIIPTPFVIRFAHRRSRT